MTQAVPGTASTSEDFPLVGSFADESLSEGSSSSAASFMSHRIDSASFRSFGILLLLSMSRSKNSKACS